ncbi:MAG: HEAT repeat domain-containing protein [Ignavibacteriaceae bacterium]|nr:HEAT repeat domain-containing protein [Ignavibacteriaceae bacterium]
MKKTLIIFVVLLSVLLINSAFAKNPLKNLSETKRIAAIENLMVGLKSDNQGLKNSSVFLLGELKADKSVIPLMKLLKSSENEDTRILAALSLLKIGDQRGIYAIKQAIKFDDSERVSKTCKKFYQEYLIKQIENKEL